MKEPTTFAEAVADVPARDLAALTGVSTQAAHAWKNETSLPAPTLVPMIAKRFGWPFERLAGLYILGAVAIADRKKLAAKGAAKS